MCIPLMLSRIQLQCTYQTVSGRKNEGGTDYFNRLESQQRVI